MGTGDSSNLEEIFWNLEIRTGSSVYYFSEVNKTLTVNYVGVEFDVEIIELDLDTARITKPALLSARAKTRAANDSTGDGEEYTFTVYL